MRKCFHPGCLLQPRWEFEYDNQKFRACDCHMDVAMRTSRQAMISRHRLWPSKNDTQELPLITRGSENS